MWSLRVPADKKKLSEYEHSLHNQAAPIHDRLNAMVCLSSLKSLEAAEALIMAFEYEVKSELLRHEICYSLGQMEISKKYKARV